MLKRLLGCACLSLSIGSACATSVHTQQQALISDMQRDPAAPMGQLPVGGPKPSAYRLDLIVIPEQSRFTGHVEIDVDMPAGARRVYMHGRDLKVNQVVVRAAGRTIPATFRQIDRTGVARLDLTEAAAGGPATLVFDYSAPFGDRPSGMYHIEVGGLWYAWTQFESIDARAAFPSFDEPGFKTPFTISVTTTSGQTVVSNAQEIGVSSTSDGFQTHRFAPTKPLPTYLVAIDTGPFDHPTTTISSDPERLIPLPLGVVATRAQADKTAFVLAQTRPIVKLLEAYFGQPFPFPKLDQIGSPEMPGAMENAGADTYADDIIFLDKDATTTQQQGFGQIVSHELSHQWFGDLVSPAWWDDIWLNESFANWMGYRIGSEWRPDLHIGSHVISGGFKAMDTDALEQSHPVHQHIATNGEIDSAFDTITYFKGAQVISMIAAYMGDDAFRAGVRLHLSRHMYGNASTDQFFAALADSAKDARIVPAMRSFVDQPGTPLVTFTRSGSGFTVEQSRYALLGEMPKAERWIVPLCVNDAGKRVCTLLDRKSTTVKAPTSGPLMPNAGGTGYYRFELPGPEWKALIHAMPNLSTGEALATDDSLWASFKAGRAAPATLLDEARFALENSDTEVRVMPGQRMAALRLRGVISGGAEFAYRRFMGSLYLDKLRQIGFDPVEGAYAADAPDDQQFRERLVDLVAKEAEDAPTCAKLANAAQRYVAGDSKALDQAYMAVAFWAYVKATGVPAAQALADRAVSSEDPVFRGAVMSTISTTGREDVAEWALTYRNPREHPDERLSLIGGLMSNAATVDMGADYILENYDALAQDNGIFIAGRLTGVLSSACSAARANKIEATLGTVVRARGVGVPAFERTVETVRHCGDLKSAREADLAAALNAAKNKAF